MVIKAIIFDMDGVLVDSMKCHIKSWKYACNKFGISTTYQDFAIIEGMTSREVVDWIFKKYDKKISIAEKNKICLIKKEQFSKLFKYKIYPQIPQLLTYLKNKNIKLALVSGSNKEFVKKILTKFFKNYFEVIITGDDVEKGKPNPEPYLKTIKKLNIKAENLLVIENAPFGIESAKGSKIKTFALATTLNKKYLKNADRIFSSHSELTRYIHKII